MKCTIPSQCIKLFARSIQCLSRIGDELFLEALKDGLAVRTVNSSRSAYACFTFNRIFFEEYEQGCQEITESTDPNELLKCKMTMKSCLGVFKSMATIEKTVQRCVIEFKPTACRLVFSLHCYHGIIKTHQLSYQECESLLAVFSKQLCPNQIVTQPKILQDTVSNFPNNCAEICLCVSPDKVIVRNYIDDEPDPSKVVFTEMTLVPEEFDDFQIGIDTQVTFCLKELRAILSFSEFANQPVAVHFEHPGRPIIFSMTNDPAYSSDFVIATLSENDGDTLQSTVGNTTQCNTTINSNISRTAQNKNISTQNAANKANSQVVSTKRKAELIQQNGHEKIISTVNNLSKQSSNNNTKLSTAGSTKEKFIALKNKKQTSSLNLSNSQIVPDNDLMDISANCNLSPQTAASKDPFFSASFPIQEMMHENPPPHSEKTKTLLQSHFKNNIPVAEEMTENVFEEDDDVLMGTPPPAKKVFRNSFLASQERVQNSMINRTLKTKQPMILAEDTDDED